MNCSHEKHEPLWKTWWLMSSLWEMWLHEPGSWITHWALVHGEIWSVSQFVPIPNGNIVQSTEGHINGPVATSVRSRFMPVTDSSLLFALVPSRFPKINQDSAAQTLCCPLNTRTWQEYKEKHASWPPPRKCGTLIPLKVLQRLRHRIFKNVF